MKSKILGITAEYDPFHNGHAYHLECAKSMVSPDATICVMSGDITQRGQLAIADKWTRARIALNHGLDMVLELPLIFACSPAKTFATGAVDILINAGATHIAFGCEAEEPEGLIELSRLQISEADRIEELTRSKMTDGISYVKARQLASTEILGEDLTILSLTPNNILALEYLRRMASWEKQGRKVTAVPIIRKGSGYKDANNSVKNPLQDKNDNKSYAGGSAIRDMIKADWNVSEYLPYDIASDYGAVWTDLKASNEKILTQLKGIVLRTTPEDISKYRFIGEGIEHKLTREISEADTYDDLLKRLTSRRYTTSTIRRMLISILLGLTKADADDIEDGLLKKHSLYGRILALDNKGRELISAASDLPFIANINKTSGIPDISDRSLKLDIKSADLFNLLTDRDMNKSTDHRSRPYIRTEDGK